MQGEKWAKQKELLEAKEQELSKGFRVRNQITLPKTPEMEETAQMVVEQDLAVQNRSLAADLLCQIWAALDRITDGSYGTCQLCGAEIQPHRLEVVPWAAYCTPCQEALDQRRAEIAAQPRESVGAKASTREEHAA
jgi:RNA polymerase-binding transcription factor DksA